MPAATYRAGDWVLLRVPSRPFDVFAREVERGALTQEELRRRLDDPPFRAALGLASPEMLARLSSRSSLPEERDDDWRDALTIYRYLARISWRATPFGLFAGVALGELGDGDGDGGLRLERGGEIHVRTTAQRVREVVRAFAVSNGEELPLRVNDTIVRVLGKLRFSEGPWLTEAPSSVVETTASDALLHALAVARALGSATVARIAEESGRPPRFVASMAKSGLLLPDVFPSMAAPDPLRDARERAARSGIAGRDLVAELDALAAANERDRGLLCAAFEAKETPPATAFSRDASVDLVRQASVRVPSHVARDVLGALLHMQRWVAPLPDGELLRFRDAFLRKFESRWVPLGVALDLDHGVPFDGGAPPPSAWARGLPSDHGPAAASTFDARDAARLRLLTDALARGTHVDLDVDVDAEHGPSRWPEGFVALVQLLAKDTSGRHRVVLRGCVRPSGLQVMGRFAAIVPGLADRIAEQVRSEAALAPEVIFADIAHEPTRLPDGNLLARPPLRALEIVYRGVPGASSDRRVEISDLSIAVRDGRVVLWSRSRGREVRVRNVNAHVRAADQSGVYRLLLALMRSDGGIADRWSWGPLEGLPFLPRVVWRNVVLSPARWQFSSSERASNEGAATPIERIAALRAERRLPRWVVIVSGDVACPVDLTSEIGARVALAALSSAKAEHVFFEELLPGAEDLCVTGPDGGYTNELLVPFLRREIERGTLSGPSSDDPSPVFLPGSEWLYLKVYAAPSRIDALAGLLAETVASSDDKAPWFFVRYADPDVHLRFRVHRAAAEAPLEGVLLAVLERARAAGLVSRVQVDTYVPELDRYGGAAGQALFEAFSWRDSEAVTQAIALLGGDAEARIVASVLAHDRYLQSLVPDDIAAMATLDTLIETSARACHLGAGGMRELARRFRAREEHLSSAIESPSTAPWDALASAFERAAAAVAEERERLVGLTRPFEHVLGSLLHMHANRILVSAHPSDELVVQHAVRRLREKRRRRT